MCDEPPILSPDEVWGRPAGLNPAEWRSWSGVTRGVAPSGNKLTRRDLADRRNVLHDGAALMLPIWAIGVAGIGAVLLLGLARLAWLSAGATPMADPRWLAEAARTAARLG